MSKVDDIWGEFYEEMPYVDPEDVDGMLERLVAAVRDECARATRNCDHFNCSGGVQEVYWYCTHCGNNGEATQENLTLAIEEKEEVISSFVDEFGVKHETTGAREYRSPTINVVPGFPEGEVLLIPPVKKNRQTSLRPSARVRPGCRYHAGPEADARDRRRELLEDCQPQLRGAEMKLAHWFWSLFRRKPRGPRISKEAADKILKSLWTIQELQRLAAQENPLSKTVGKEGQQ